MPTSRAESLRKARPRMGIRLTTGTAEVPSEFRFWMRPPMTTVWPSATVRRVFTSRVKKAGAELAIETGHELKLAYPKAGAEPKRFEHLEFDRFYLQPVDGPNLEENTRSAVRYCLENPKWRLSLQIQHILGIP